MMSTTEGELDIEVAGEREEGELDDSDVEEGTYIPLARPEAFNPPSLVQMQIQDEQSDEASPQESSCSDSDEELRRRPKRTKVKPTRPQPHAQPDKKDKYNVWCKALQEDLLTEDMVGCDVTKKRSLGIESYDYTIKYRLDDNYSKKVFKNNEENDRTSNKRRNSDRSNVKLRLGKRVNSHQSSHWKKEPRVLQDLIVSATDPEDNIAADIGEKLNEEKTELILRVVQVLGREKAIQLFKETQKLEEDGGMMVMNGTRRRTPGGIYFFLLKRDDAIPQEKINEILNEDRNKTKRKIKKSKAKTRQNIMAQLKQSLTDSEINSLSRGEAIVQSEHGSNPPPSPATDARDCSSDTDGHTDGHVDTPRHTDTHIGHRDTHIGHPDTHIGHRDTHIGHRDTHFGHRDSHIGHPDTHIGHPDSHIGHPDTHIGHPDTHIGPHQGIPPDPRALQEYDDGDFLEVMVNDDMDLF